MFPNVDLNATGSNYSQAPYSHSTDNLIKQAIHSIIYDTAPQQWLDLTVLNQKAALKVPSDEWEFAEMSYGRSPVVPSGTIVGGTSAVTITTTDTSMCSLDMIVVFPDDTKGTITTLTADTSIVVTPQLGVTLPTVYATDTLGLLSPIEADAASTFKTYFREDVTKRYAFIQMIAMSMRFGKMELYKLSNTGWFSNYLTMNRQRFINYYKTSISNIYWNGTQGEATLSGGEKAKTSGGVYQAMLAAGSMTVSATEATIGAAVEDLALSTEYGAYGQERFLYMTPKMHVLLSKYYKDQLTRYTPDNMLANLMLKKLDIGSSAIVFVPMARWNSEASFGALWQRRMLLVDQAAITPLYALEEEYGSTLDRVDRGTRENFKDEWITGTFGLQYVNPLSGGIINVA
jgi:hypothetical protein